MILPISVICCYNNEAVYQNSLVASIHKQNDTIELIGVDNTKHQYSSAAKALNAGAKQAQHDLFVFIHQDVFIEDPDFFSMLLQYHRQFPHHIVGVAGVNEKGEVLTNITQGNSYELAGLSTVKEPIKAETLDEVMIAIPKELFVQNPFDEKTCNHWHLYGVDLCLSLHLRGYDSLIVPLHLHHLSSGKLSTDYALTLYRVVRKYRKQYSRIQTTCSNTKTSFLRSSQYILGLIWDHGIKRH